MGLLLVVYRIASEIQRNDFYKYNNFYKDFKKIKIFKFNDAIEEFKNGN